MNQQFLIVKLICALKKTSYIAHIFNSQSSNNSNNANIDPNKSETPLLFKENLKSTKYQPSMFNNSMPKRNN